MELKSICLKDHENDNIWDFHTYTTSYLINWKIENKHPEKARDLHKSKAEVATQEQCQRHVEKYQSQVTFWLPTCVTMCQGIIRDELV